MEEILSSVKLRFRERIFSPLVTFWMFLSQVLSDGASCQEMVARALALLWIAEGQDASSGNSAYCQARKRIPEFCLEQIAEATAARLERQVCKQHLWMGRHVRIVDGSSLSMPDTPENQGAYPQPRSQKAGCGFPVMRVVVIFSLATGAILKLARGALSQSERFLFQGLQPILQAGEVLLADRGFCSFAEVHILMQRGVDAVLRNHQRRSVGLRCIRKLGRRDRLVEWFNSSKVCPAWMKKEVWQQIPDKLMLREITYTLPVPGFRSETIIVVTTLTDPKLFPTEVFIDLYRRRWQAELFLRDIKISLHMDVLRCKTPAMVHKELWMHIIAYNLIRSLMWKAAQQHQVSLHSISFKSSLALVRQWAPYFAGLNLSNSRISKMQKRFLQYLAEQIVPERPGRREPRARKRRPKNFALLTTTRRQFKEIIHRNRYRKDLN